MLMISYMKVQCFQILSLIAFLIVFKAAPAQAQPSRFYFCCCCVVSGFGEVAIFVIFCSPAQSCSVKDKGRV